MLRLKPSAFSKDQSGITLVELMIVVAITGIISSTVYLFFNNSIVQYLHLQKDGSSFGELNLECQRIANVLRGLTDIASASSNDLQVYAYFSPSDTYVSQIHYYENSNKTQLLADVTQMTADPPVGTPIVSTKKTYVIIENLYQKSGVDLFTYLDESSNVLAEPISDLTTIKGIRIELAAPSTYQNAAQSITLQVSLRNRKTNL